MIGTPFRDENLYQQVSLKATTPDCRWSYTLLNEEQDKKVTFEFIVWPMREPTHEGTLVVLDSLDWNAVPHIPMAAGEVVTIRLTETADKGFGWERPTHDW